MEFGNSLLKRPRIINRESNMTEQELVNQMVGCEYSNLQVYDSNGKLTSSAKTAHAFSFVDDTGSKIYRVLYDKMRGNLVVPDDVYNNRPTEHIYKRITERGFQLYLNYLQGGGLMNLTTARGELANATL